MAGVRLERSSRMAPSPVPVLTVTVRVAPGPALTLVTEAPVTVPVVVNPKLPVATPVTDSLKATV